MNDNPLYVIDKVRDFGKVAAPYQIRFYKDRVEEVGIGAGNYQNILSSIRYKDIKNVEFKRDWNRFFLKYALYFLLTSGNTKKLSGGLGLTLEEATKASNIITSQHPIS